MVLRVGWELVKAIAKKIPYQVWCLIGFGLTLWLYGAWQYQQGKNKIQAEWTASIERGKARIEQLKENQLTVNMVVDTIYQERTEFIYVKGKTLVEQIPVYIPIDTPDLPGGFRVLHDAAATSTIPSPTESESAAPVRVEEATSTIIDNYTTCLAIREEVVAWRSWYPEQVLLWQKSVSKQQ